MFSSRHGWRLWVGLLCCLCSRLAAAELTVDITRGVAGSIPLAVVPYAQPGLGGDNLGTIIAADLERSGRFNLMPVGQMPERPAPPDPVDFGVWQAAGQEHVTIGRVIAAGAGQYEAEYFLFDVIRGVVMSSGRIPFPQERARQTAHRIADIIYRQLTGERGIFDTRVAYISVSGDNQRRAYRLEIADSDGQNVQTVVTSAEPLMSPAWSPDGKQLAYVSFEEGRSAVFVQALASGERQKVSSSPGINGAPAWSPDGTRLALTLSKDGSPDIYVLDLKSQSLQRLTHEASIETEPNWAPDGRSLVFTSDRGGTPQIYLQRLGEEAAERLTFDGDYHARAVFSPDGRYLAMVQGSGGAYRIALMDLESREVRPLTAGPLDESPGFSPDGQFVLFAHVEGGQNRLSAVSIDGKRRQRLALQSGSLRAPAWSP